MLRMINRRTLAGFSGVALLSAMALTAGCGSNESEVSDVDIENIQGAPIGGEPDVSEPVEVVAPASEEVEAEIAAAPLVDEIPAPPTDDVPESEPTSRAVAEQAADEALEAAQQLAGPAPADPLLNDASAGAEVASGVLPGPAGVPVMPPHPSEVNIDFTDRERDKDGYLPLTFSDLASYLYEYPDIDVMDAPPAGETASIPGEEDRIPESIRKLEGEMITVQGFMIPSEVEKGKIKAFVLVKDQMGCCFGVMPMMNEWVYVTMEGDKRSEFLPDVPLKVSGRLHVGEEVQEGMVVSVYRVDGHDVTPLSTMPKKLGEQGGQDDFWKQGF